MIFESGTLRKIFEYLCNCAFLTISKKYVTNKCEISFWKANLNETFSHLVQKSPHNKIPEAFPTKLKNDKLFEM